MENFLEMIFPAVPNWWHVISAYVIGFYTFRSARRLITNMVYFVYFNMFLGLFKLMFSESVDNNDNTENGVQKEKPSMVKLEQSYNPKAAPVLGKIRNLQNRLDRLYGNISQVNLDQCKSELEKCKAMMQNIRDLMTYQKINFSDVFIEVQNVREKIVDIDFAIARKDNVWWKKLKRILFALLNLARMKLLGPG